MSLTDILALLGLNLALIIAVMTGLWLVSLKVRDVSFIDAVWPMAMLSTLPTGAGAEAGSSTAMSGTLICWPILRREGSTELNSASFTPRERLP